MPVSLKGGLAILGLLSVSAAHAAVMPPQAVLPSARMRPAAEATRASNALARTASSSFVENRGQWPDDVRYLARLGGLDAWITTSGVTYDAHVTERTDAEPDDRAMRSGPERPADEREDVHRRGHVLQMRFLGGREPETIRTGNRQPGVHNYFLGNDSTRWASNVPLYDEVTAVGVYEGVDTRYYIDGASVRYDLIVAPGAAAEQIRLAFDGAEDIRVAADGALVLATSVGEVRHEGLHTYQEVGGSRVTVPSRFVVVDGSVHIELSAYDRTRALVIDPLVYSTFIGGSATELTTGMVVTSDGSVHLSGYTSSALFPRTTGAYDISFNGITDTFVLKLSADGSSLVYGTFIGGPSEDWAAGIAIDASGAAYVTGYTGSTSFPTTENGYDTTHNDNYDVFVTILSPNGSSLIYSTFLGGNAGDSARDIAIDQTGAFYIIGQTSSRDFPTTPGAYDTTQNGISDGDGFVTKFSPGGGSLAYSTFLGGILSGPEDDFPNQIEVDASGAAYVAGWTEAPDFPTTPGAYDTTHNGENDGFLTKVTPDGSSLGYSTFLGGTARDIAFGLIVDPSGVAYVCGSTDGADFPTTPAAYDRSHSGGDDVYVASISQDGSSLAYSTFLGGDSDDQCNDITLDSEGHIYVSGRTQSVDYPTTPITYDSKHNGGYDAFLTRFSSDMSALDWSTFFGGSADERAHRILVDDSGSITIAGRTRSPEFPVTPGAFDTNHNGGDDVYVSRFSPLPVSSEQPAGLPAVFTLSPPQPNPTAELVTLAYELATPATVSIGVYDRLGRRVAKVAEQMAGAGRHEVVIDASVLAVGLYVVRAAVQPSDGRVAQTSSHRFAVVR